MQRYVCRHRHLLFYLTCTAQRQQLLRIADKCPIHKLMTTTDIQVQTRLAEATA